MAPVLLSRHGLAQFAVLTLSGGGAQMPAVETSIENHSRIILWVTSD